MNKVFCVKEWEDYELSKFTLFRNIEDAKNYMIDFIETAIGFEWFLEDGAEPTKENAYAECDARNWIIDDLCSLCEVEIH